jgi:PPM family protein phosphatase
MTSTQGSHQIRAACANDAGRIRQTNQDSYLIDLEQNLFIVSDGMGGHLAGEVASKAVVTVLPELIRRRLAGLSSASNRTVELALREVVLELSQRLRAESAGRPGLQGMGATLAMALLRPEPWTAHLAHLGDSRIYLFRDHHLTQLTEDHSIVALLLKHGEINREEARRHPARGRLSRYVGIDGDVYPDLQSIALLAGDRLLICSDGLTNMIPDDMIARLIHKNPAPSEACRKLVAAANSAGGEDNITVLLVNLSLAKKL